MPGKVEKSSSDGDKHEGDATAIAYHNGHVFSAGADGTIKVWDANLNLENNLIHHFASYIYALAVSSEGKIYSASNDGLVKCVANPLTSTEALNLYQSDDIVQCLYCDGDRVYLGDEKGVVTQWQNDNLMLVFHLVEEIKSLAAEGNLVYTVRDLDVLVTEIIENSKVGRYSVKATIVGKSPLALCGPVEDGKHAYLVFCTRAGFGVTLVDNRPGKIFANLWTKEKCHSMIITAICGNAKALFTGGYDKTVKMWTNLEKECKLAGEVSLRSCVNFICNGENDHTIYAATSDGMVHKVVFS